MLRKFSDDGQTDRQTDGQTDEIDFIRRCPTDVERPINEFAYLLNLRLTKRRVCVKQDSVISDKLLLISSILSPPKKQFS